MNFARVQQTKAHTSDCGIFCPSLNEFKTKGIFWIKGLGFFKWSGCALQCTAENLKETSLFHPLA